VISSTISIFSSVLIFLGFDGVVDLCVEIQFDEIKYEPSWTAVFAGFGQFLVWFCLLQVTIASISFRKFDPEEGGYAARDPALPNVVGNADNVAMGRQVSPMTNTSSVFFEGHHHHHHNIKDPHKRKMLMMKCWAVLLAHTTGFAAIHAGGELQHLEIFAATPFRAFMVLLVQWGFLTTIFFTSDGIRTRHGVSEEVKIWDEETEEAENDIASLAISFLFVQALRFYLSGVLPNRMGLEVPQHRHPMSCIYGLLVASVTCTLVSLLVMFAIRPVEERMGEASYSKRYVLICQSTTSMAAAWCVFFAAKWLVGRMPPVGGMNLDPNSISMRVFLACVLSVVALISIFALDVIEDMESTGESVDKVIKSVINSVGILVGFSWEQAFDGGVEVIAELSESRGRWYPVLSTLLLGGLIAAVIIPAWRRYILQHTLVHDKEAKIQRRLTRRARKRRTWESRGDAFSAFFPGRTLSARTQSAVNENDLKGLYSPVPTDAAP